MCTGGQFAHAGVHTGDRGRTVASLRGGPKMPTETARRRALEGAVARGTKLTGSACAARAGASVSQLHPAVPQNPDTTSIC